MSSTTNSLRIEEHKVSIFQTYLKEIVYGGNDGIVTTFAIVAGFAGAQLSAASPMGYLTVLLFGFANLFADGVSMGLGNFLSIRSEKDSYTSELLKEQHRISTDPGHEKEETLAILVSKGFSPKDAQTLTQIYSSNPGYWLTFMMNHELELPNPEGENPTLTGLATFGSFLVFGLIPLLPYVIAGSSSIVFNLSIAATVVALITLGVLRWKLTRISLHRAILENVLIGGSAASIAYLVGSFFRM